MNSLLQQIHLVLAEGGLFDLQNLIKTVGILGVAAIVFAESGLLIGFFLPGDSLLFTAGLLASQGYIPIKWLVPVAFIAAVTGDSVGYWFGSKTGPRIFKRDDSLFFNKDHIHKAQAFYEKHGGKTIILARFMPIVRTFAPIVAGVGNMHYRTFLTYNVVGGFLWTVGMTLGGYWLGNVIPNPDRYLLPIIAIIILLSISPALWHLAKDHEQRAKLIAGLRKSLKREKSINQKEQ